MQLAYQKAIDLLMTGTVDYKGIAIGLAKHSPDLFVTLAGKPIRSDKEILDATLIELRQGAGTVAAIKHQREKTGMGLKESKDYVDALWLRHLAALPEVTPTPTYADGGSF